MISEDVSRYCPLCEDLAIKLKESQDKNAILIQLAKALLRERDYGILDSDDNDGFADATFTVVDCLENLPNELWSELEASVETRLKG